jgi:hypothetical protein
VDLSTSEEVFELNLGAILGNVCVDGEMSVYKSHLVNEALKTLLLLNWNKEKKRAVNIMQIDGGILTS